MAEARSCPAGVTIAIPNWNHELVLPRSVGSALRAARLLRRAGVAADVLVVDDCSRDGSLVFLRQAEALYWADGLRVSALRRNLGLPAVRNVALREAAHRHVAFMDADNELVPENLYLFYRSALETEAAVVYGNLIRVGPGGAADEMLSNESWQDRVLGDNYIDAFALFDRLQLADAGGYSDAAEVEAREDWEMYLHLAAAGRRAVFVPLVFGIYHDLEGSMIKQAERRDGPHAQFLKRVFDQLGVRSALDVNTRHLRYHPHLGYL